MQTIEAKLAKIAAALTAAGLTRDQGRHLIHGTGGSPRRAKRAIRMGIAPMLIEAYDAALNETGAHAKAVIACNAMWNDLVPRAAGTESDDDTPEAPEGGEGEDSAEAAATAATAAIVKAATTPPAPRRTRRSAKPEAKSADELKALLPA